MVGQTVLLLAGIASWAIALALALLENSDVVAAAFAPIGMLLIAAATLFPRLRELGPQGVKVDPSEAVRALGELLPPPPDGASPAGERARVFQAIESYLDALQFRPSDSASSAPTMISIDPLQIGVLRYQRGTILEARAIEWLVKEGFEQQRAPLDAGVDLIGRRPSDGAVAAALLLPEHRLLGPEDSFEIAKSWAAEHLRPVRAFYPIWFTDADYGRHLEKLAERGIGVLYLDPERQTLEQLVAPVDGGGTGF